MPFLALCYPTKIVWILDIARTWLKDLDINVMAIHKWKLAILSDLSARRDYHSQIYTKAAHSNWCLNAIYASVMQSYFLLWMHGWFTFQEKAHSRLDSTPVLHKKNERQWMCMIRSHHTNLYITPSSSETAFFVAVNTSFHYTFFQLLYQH